MTRSALVQRLGTKAWSPGSMASLIPRPCSCDPAGSSTLGGNDGQQKERLVAFVEVERVLAAEDLGRPILRIRVAERADARHRVRLVREAGVAQSMVIVAASNVEGQRVARRNHDGGRQDLDV